MIIIDRDLRLMLPRREKVDKSIEVEHSFVNCAIRAILEFFYYSVGMSEIDKHKLLDEFRFQIYYEHARLNVYMAAGGEGRGGGSVSQS